MSKNKFAIITTVFNHTNNPFFNKNWHEFISFLKKNNLLNDLYVCEILPHGTRSQITSSDYQNHIIYNNYKIWHKECAINYLLDKIPDNYNKVLILDNDISFSNHNWVSNAYDMLDDYILVQLFDSVVYLLHDNSSIDYIDIGMIKNYIQTNNFPEGNPGLALGYDREYLHQNNGLFDSCLVGGGDIVNIAPFITSINDIYDKIPNCTFIDHQPKIKMYIDQAKDFLVKSSKKPYQYLNNNTVFHMFHGYRSYRQYADRFNIINNLMYSDVATKSNKFYQIHNLSFINSCETYFSNRIYSSKETEPLIISSCKYGADSDTVFWLNKNTMLSIYNIKKIKIKIKNKFNFKKYKILINNQEYDAATTIDSGCIIIESYDPKNIQIICEENMIIPPDKRELCFFIQTVEIQDYDNNIINYKLNNIL
jgi:hypothetical protein